MQRFTALYQTQTARVSVDQGQTTHPRRSLLPKPDRVRLGDLAVSQPSCLLRVAWQLGTEGVLQLNDFFNPNTNNDLQLKFHSVTPFRCLAAMPPKGARGLG
ncbi:hypothetical protein T265_07819 [Opisthorchis viverrini]|uniref:Uncharacterized protein n=1 Tax=Opisthorchis viverrini TaxID=6198 RepID=A0A074ZFX3_OPIVI|nr:hypothetical protein T265_07819 [Opisthorchis viverrini]KER24552.1 hypothetical protein T265_07819 [Opisthorchis viverrini]